MAATKQKHRRTSKGVVVSQKNIMARVAEVEKTFLRPDLAEYGIGDTVKVHVKIKEGEKERIQLFEGVVIAQSNAGSNRTFVVRKISHGIGVERIFSEASPKVSKIQVVQQGKVRRSKLYYLRGLEGKAARLERDLSGTASASAAAKA